MAKLKARPAPVAAASIGIHMPLVHTFGAIGINARVGQYLRFRADGTPIDCAEIVNAARGIYKPHQGRRECERRVRQMRAGIIS